MIRHIGRNFPSRKTRSREGHKCFDMLLKSEFLALCLGLEGTSTELPALDAFVVVTRFQSGALPPSDSMREARQYGNVSSGLPASARKAAFTDVLDRIAGMQTAVQAPLGGQPRTLTHNDPSTRVAGSDDAVVFANTSSSRLEGADSRCRLSSTRSESVGQTMPLCAGPQPSTSREQPSMSSDGMNSEVCF